VATNEEIARRYADASCRIDLDAMAALRHPEWQVLSAPDWRSAWVEGVAAAGSAPDR
jgi:hypothetical protein